ncbi:MAG: hypothetical protein HKN56_01315 [Gammaproteobacteria bacterium]|nr:hypothetical protein [Gammaproteobacteria bacterium]NND53594.1 hypothetical protein [Gammaproteobacteria bacterium]
MSAFATWLAGHRIRRVVIIAGLFPLPLLGVVSAAAVVMTAMLRGPREATIDCAAGLALLLGLGFVSGMDVVTLAGSAVFSWAVWILLGALANRTGSLTLTVQATVLLALAGMVLFLLSVGDAVSYWLPILEAWYADLERQGVNIPVDLEQQAALMSGGLFAFVLSGALLSLLLGLSWAARVAGGPTLASEFRQLRLGYVIGGLAAVAGLASLIGAPLNGVLLLFGAAFSFQGAAVVAWWAERLNWPRNWWLAAVIVSVLMVQLLVILLALLAALGFVDNWFSLRRKPQAPEAR